MSENQQLGGTHSYSCFFRFSAVVDQREEGNSIRLKNPHELRDRFVHRVIAGYVDDPSHFTERHKYLCHSSTEPPMQLPLSEPQPPSAWRRRPSGWRPRLRPCGCWLVWHTTVEDQG